MNMQIFRTLGAIAAISLLGACGGEQPPARGNAAPIALTQPAPSPVPLPSHAQLHGSACAEPACQQGQADLADQYRTASMERAQHDAGAELPSYPQVPQSAMVIAEARPNEVLGSAARAVLR